MEIKYINSDRNIVLIDNTPIEDMTEYGVRHVLKTIIDRIKNKEDLVRLAQGFCVILGKPDTHNPHFNFSYKIPYK